MGDAMKAGREAKSQSYPAAIRELQDEGQLPRRCQQRTRRYCNNGSIAKFE
jgi:hypothetical protein